jgi:hypothetical protein
MPNYSDDVHSVAQAILNSPFPSARATKVLRDLEGLRFTSDDWKYARLAADELNDGVPPPSANTATRLVAAARYLYDRDPAKYAQERQNEHLIEHAQSIVYPGTRAGERVLTGDEKEKLSQTSRDLGATWFDEFASWVNVPAP